MSLDDLGVVDFQLYLLETMMLPESRLTPALEELGFSVDDMLASYEAVSRLTKLRPGQARRFKSIINEVLLGTLNVADRETSVYKLPLWWPKFTFLVSIDDSGEFLYRAEFGKGPDYRPEGQVAPWEFLEMDLVDKFDEVRDIDLWSSYASYFARDRSLGQRYFLRFGWGLLQEMKIAED
jgi:hypothetical protein